MRLTSVLCAPYSLTEIVHRIVHVTRRLADVDNCTVLDADDDHQPLNLISLHALA